MKNPTAGAPIITQGDLDKKRARAAIAKMSKQIDRVRNAVKRLESKAPYSPALQRAKQFMASHNITSLGQTKWIKTASQLREYKQFLKVFEKYSTSTVRGAKAALSEQMNSLEGIMKVNGWDPSEYSVNDLYNELNKIDLYQIMNDYHISSGEIVGGATVIMNTKRGKKVTAYNLLNQIFGTPVAKAQALTKYSKGTKAHMYYKRRIKVQKDHKKKELRGNIK